MARFKGQWAVSSATVRERPTSLLGFGIQHYWLQSRCLCTTVRRDERMVRCMFAQTCTESFGIHIEMMVASATCAQEGVVALNTPELITVVSIARVLALICDRIRVY